MLRLFICLVALIASVWFGIEIVKHPGFMLIVYQPWMVQMPLWFALLSLMVALAVFYVLINSIDRIKFSWYRIKNWFRFRREHQLFSKTQAGLCALIEGEAKQAERLLMAGVNQAVDPLINYLAAAKAAQAQEAFDRRDNYIQLAYKIAPHDDLAIGITQAELEIEQHRYEQAAATLHHLLQRSPKHPRILQLLEKAYVHLGDWQQLITILPSMRKAKILNPIQFEQFEKNLYSELLRGIHAKDLEMLQRTYANVPRHMRKQPDVVYAYVKQLLRFPHTEKEIEELIRQMLKHYWHSELVNIYSTLPFDNLNQQLVIAGAWLKMYGQRQELLLLLGKICMRIQLWGKAKDYFEKCIELSPNALVYLEYGKLLEQLNEPNAALEKYRSGLEQFIKG